MFFKTFKIATRSSDLALWQSNHVKRCINQKFPSLPVKLLKLKTKGDHILDKPISEIGGKGIFTKELQNALLDQKADIAVHSLKDVTSEFHKKLEISTILKRDNPFDALILKEGESIKDIKKGSTIGTSSLRRASQILHYRPDLKIKPLRGNLATRLKKIEDGFADAAILAFVGLTRLNLQSKVSEIFKPDFMLPAIGQGAICIENRRNDNDTKNIIKHLNDEISNECARAERRILIELNANCKFPLAGYCVLKRNNLYLRGLIGSKNGEIIITAEGHSSRRKSEELGKYVARKLIEKGGKELLKF